MAENTPDAWMEFVASCEEELAVLLTAGEIAELRTALMVAEDAIEMVRTGEPTEYLRERLSDPEDTGALRGDAETWSDLEAKLGEVDKRNAKRRRKLMRRVVREAQDE